MKEDAYLSVHVGKQKHIALIAHDGRKTDLLNWVEANKEALSYHFLSGTGTTATLISEQVELPVRPYKSGPLGGDQQMGSLIADGKIDFLIFFWDPLSAHPHDPDVKALLRIAVLYDIPVANNQASADFMLNSPMMSEEYDHNVLDFAARIRDRAIDLAKEGN